MDVEHLLCVGWRTYGRGVHLLCVALRIHLMRVAWKTGYQLLTAVGYEEGIYDVCGTDDAVWVDVVRMLHMVSVVRTRQCGRTMWDGAGIHMVSVVLTRHGRTMWDGAGIHMMCVAYAVRQ